MSQFVRTPIGIRNYSLFMGGNFVVFLEGKDSTARKTSFEQSFDEIFWTPLIKEHLGTSNFVALSGGNKFEVFQKIKTTLNATSLQNSQQQIILGCVDRDYDCHDTDVELSKFAPYLLVTQGYSFENDLLCRFELKEIIGFIEPRAKASIAGKFKDAWQQLSRILCRLATIDRATRRHGFSIIPTKGDLDFIKFKMNNDGTLKCYVCRKSYLKYKENIVRKHNKSKLSEILIESNQRRMRFRIGEGRFADGLLCAPGGFVLNLIARLMGFLSDFIAGGRKFSANLLCSTLLSHQRS